MTPSDGRMTKHGMEVSYNRREMQGWKEENITNIEDMIGQLPTSVRHMINGFQIPSDEGEQSVNTLLCGELVAACDRSVKENTGTYGYIFSNRQQTKRWS